MSSEMTIIEGVAQLVEDMQQDVENGTIELSADDWAQLDSKLQQARRLLEKTEINDKELDDATWLIIAAFEENKTLDQHFGKRLKALTGGTRTTARKDRLTSKRKIRQVKNKMVKFIEQVKQENNAQKSTSPA